MINLIKGISLEEQFGVVHPVIEKFRYDELGIPILKEVSENRLDFSNIQPINIQSLSNKKNNTKN